MPLVPCPECGRQISTAAAACPQCGHPTAKQSVFEKPRDENSFDFANSSKTSPQCYGCRSPATTRCVRCGALSCAVHLQSIYVSHGKGGAYELRCETCYANAKAWQKVGYVILGVVVVIMIIMMSGFFSKFHR